jgi:hypothetical protein
MAAKSKTQAVPQAQTALRAVECLDDSFSVVGGGDLKATPFAIHPDAGAIELAIGVQTRLKRLLTLIRNVSTTDADEDTFDALAGYAEEIVALADAMADKIQCPAQSMKAIKGTESEAVSG